MNRGYYKQGQSSKVPYLMVVIIIALLWIIKGMHEDVKDANKMFEEVIRDFPQNDSIVKMHKQEVDSLNAVIDWYRKQDEDRKAKPDAVKKKKAKETKAKETAPTPTEPKDSI